MLELVRLRQQQQVFVWHAAIRLLSDCVYRLIAPLVFPLMYPVPQGVPLASCRPQTRRQSSYWHAWSPQNSVSSR